eukprot:763312-Hanusia_phi.AAC.4
MFTTLWMWRQEYQHHEQLPLAFNGTWPSWNSDLDNRPVIDHELHNFSRISDVSCSVESQFLFPAHVPVSACSSHIMMELYLDDALNHSTMHEVFQSAVQSHCSKPISEVTRLCLIEKSNCTSRKRLLESKS